MRKEQEVRLTLERVKNGSLSVEDAEKIIADNRYTEMEYAKLDTDRKERTGFSEVVYCSGKKDEFLLNSGIHRLFSKMEQV